MRLDINLATHRYEDAGRFWLRWGAGLGILAIATLALVAITISGLYDARIDHKKIAELQAKIAERDHERASAEAMLNRSENRSMRDKSQYLNELIARKAFSWTKAFEDLEKVMPPRLHVVSIAPELNEDNQLAIKMLVAGDSSDRAIELVRRMEDSRHFQETRIETYGAASQQAGGDTVQFAINALYVPAPDQPPPGQPAHAQPARPRPVHTQRGAK